MYASMNMEDGSGVVTSIKRASIAAMKPFQPAEITNSKLRVAHQKTDRIEITSRGLSTRHIIHDTLVQKRGSREFISIKPYVRILATLSTAKPQDASKKIPNFNPYKLYANTTPLLNANSSQPSLAQRDVTVKVLELVGGILPEEDGQELPMDEIGKIVSEVGEIYSENELAIKPAILPDGDNSSAQQNLAANESNNTISLPPKTTIIEKSVEEDTEVVLDQHETKVIKVKKGDILVRLLRKIGAEAWQAKTISDAVATVVPNAALKIGQELRFTLIPAPSGNNQMEPIAVSLFSGETHHVTVIRNEDGHYVASKDVVDLTVIDTKTTASYPRRANVYTSLYHSALVQNIPEDSIVRMLRIHAYNVDFKRRTQAGDSFEAFFDTQNMHAGQDGSVGELLFTSVNVAGASYRFYRFRTPDGVVDYYDEKGSNSKKFLMRKPVRGARYTSGFGFRIHPLLRQRRMHTGVDWAAPRGTPILAAGNGIIEAVGGKGGYGNYIRIRHANGYKTAYGHLYKYAQGLKKGMKVKQGQVIGYVGSTGRSSGPHLHYEVLVNNRHVNPMKIEVPHGRQLKGRELAEFQKERTRIDELMRRSPVKTRVAKAEN